MLRAATPLLFVTAGVLPLAAGACVQEASPPPRVVPRPEPPAASQAPALPEPPPQYVVGDPQRPTPATVLPLGDEGTGIVVEGLRFVLHGAQVRAARDVGAGQLQAAWHVPPWLGGGYLFRAGPTLYASPTFDGLLRPVVAMPREPSTLSFGPKAVLVRADSGERWMIQVATGKRVAIDPPGLLEVAALDDRAAALVEGGLLLVSTDHGDHWKDVTASMKSPPRHVYVGPAAKDREEGVWIETQAGTAYGVLPAGRLAEFDALPSPPPVPGLRPPQDAWREDEPPIRRAVRLGAPSRDGAAIVAAGGDIVQVDVVSGAVDVLAAGKIPPDAVCTATRTPDDVVLTCGRGYGAAFAVSHVLDRAVVVEQALPDGGHFVVSDDGGILWTAACDRPRPNARRVACVRSTSGVWQEVDLDPPGDGGAPAPYNVVRWIPRGDGGAIAVVSDIGGQSGVWGMVDTRSGEIHAWPADALTGEVRNALGYSESPRGLDAGRLVDRGWTVSGQGTLRGWANVAGGMTAVDIGLDGSLQTSPFAFERVATAGPIALARTREGRVWQTLDRGTTWSEVAAPPVMRSGGWLDVRACSLVGCDLGQWYRIGWAPTAPFNQQALTTAPPAPHLDRASTPVLACRPTGDAKRAEVNRGERSPDDLGLGAVRVAVADGKGLTDFLRLSFQRKIVGSIRETDTNDEGAPRAIVHGPSTQPGEDRLTVQGYDRNVLALARQVAFVPAFDPTGPVRRVPLTMADLLAGGRAAGVAQATLLSDDPIPMGVVPVTPLDPATPDDLLVQLGDGGTALMRATAGGKVHAAYELARGDDARIVSAAALDADTFGMLEEDGTGRATVLRVGARVSTVFTIDPPPNGDFYPANLDALAVGPHGELGILRTPSGGEPATAEDPAMVLVAGAPALPLAAWSTLTPADDPACKGDAAGWRATVQTMLPWIRLVDAGDLRGADDARMLARVRWSAARACLEAVELRTQDFNLGVPSGAPYGGPWDAAVESWVVARFAAGGAAAPAGRVIVLPGAEMRQPLACKLAASP